MQLQVPLLLQISGGTIPSSYQWNNGTTTPTISNLLSGMYSCQITDSNGCIVDTSLVVEPALNSLIILPAEVFSGILWEYFRMEVLTLALQVDSYHIILCGVMEVQPKIYSTSRKVFIRFQLLMEMDARFRQHIP
ncbi:MAG: hypothetical protein IPN54_09360 [Bacteroidetes bacterium]|nr:hypothetical protein [Bacteroidota bacterium]